MLLNGRKLKKSFGSAEGQTYARIQDQHPEMFSRQHETDPNFAPPGGESRQQHFDRVRERVTALADEFVGQRLLLVTHGGVLGCIYRWLHAIEVAAPHPIDIPNAAYNLIGCEEGIWRIDGDRYSSMAYWLNNPI